MTDHVLGRAGRRAPLGRELLEARATDGDDGELGGDEEGVGQHEQTDGEHAETGGKLHSAGC